MCKQRSAFTILDSLVVIGIIGILVGLSLPAVQQSRDAAMRIACANHIRNIGLALHGFHDAYEQFPSMSPDKSRYSARPYWTIGWMVLVLPYIEQSALYQTSLEACEKDSNYKHNPPHVGFATVVKTYVCPDDTRLTSPLTDQLGVRAAFTSYIGIGGVGSPDGVQRGKDGVICGVRCRMSDITDGSSHTIMAGERPPPASLQAGWWYPVFGPIKRACAARITR